MLHLMKQNVPNGPLLLCQSDEGLISLARKHNVPVPQELMIHFSSSAADAIVLPSMPVEPPPPPPEVAVGSTSTSRTDKPAHMSASKGSASKGSASRGHPPADMWDPAAALSTDHDEMPSARVVAKPKKLKGRKRGKAAAAPGEHAVGGEVGDESEYSIDKPPSTRRLKPKRLRKRPAAREPNGSDAGGWAHTPRTAAAL